MQNLGGKMKYKIKHRYSGKVLFSLETKSFRLCIEAAIKSKFSLSHAALSNANMYNAALSHANLSHANLSYANLSHANLSYANLSNANLSNANLYNAKGINYHLCTPLSFLKDQVGKIRAYKLVNKDYTGPYYKTITYEIGKTYSEKEACEDESSQCAQGISLATLDWCMKEWKQGYHILVAEFTRKDIAAIPIATDGKFRVSKCKIIREKNLEKLGLK